MLTLKEMADQLSPLLVSIPRVFTVYVDNVLLVC